MYLDMMRPTDPETIDTDKTVHYLQFPRRNVPHHVGLHKGVPGWVRRQKE